VYHYTVVSAASATVCTELLAEGSVPITTYGAGGTSFTSAAKPKSGATAPASVMRLGFNNVERAQVRVVVGERVYAGAMAAQIDMLYKLDTKPLCTAVRAVYRPNWNTIKRAEHGS
jgi:hypothetical protein